MFPSLGLGRNRTTSGNAPPPSSSSNPHPLAGMTELTSPSNAEAIGSESTVQSERENTTNELGPTNVGVEGVASTSPNIPLRESSSNAFASIPFRPRQKHSRTESGGSNVVGSHTHGHGHVHAPPFISHISTASNASVATVGPSTLNIIPAVAAPTASTTTTSTSSSYAALGSNVPFSSSSSTTGASGNTSGNGLGGVQARLQLQSLKAGGQRMGLGNGSLGMKLLDVVYEKGMGLFMKGMEKEWVEIVMALTTGQATLLLPSSPIPSSTTITPQLLRDHIIYTSPYLLTPSSTPAPSIMSGSTGKRRGNNRVVTMSGLLGVVDEHKIIWDGAVDVDSRLLVDLKDPLARSSTLASLQPPNFSCSESLSTFPTFSLGDTSSTLPFPPLPTMPPVPTSNSTSSPASRSRSGSNASLASLSSLSVLPTPARLNPFMSLFGHANPRDKEKEREKEKEGELGREAMLTPPKNRRLGSMDTVNSSEGMMGLSTSPAKSFLGLKSGIESPPLTESVKAEMGIGKNPNTEGFEIPGWVIHKTMKHAEVAKGLSKALKGVIQETLGDLPDKTVERVVRFILGSHPCNNEVGKSQLSTPIAGTPTIPSDSFLKFVNADEMANTVQSFLEAIYDELYAYHITNGTRSSPESPSILKRRGSLQKKKSGTTLIAGETEEDMGKRLAKEKRAMEEVAEKAATEGTDLVEGMITVTFYDSLFRPPHSDDERHDEALSSRIAALNMLDLSLDHLGVMVKDDEGGRLTGSQKEERDEAVEKGLDEIVRAVGEELQRLNAPDQQNPKSKAQIMITGHRIVIDGLAKLPRIRLRPEGEEFKPAEGTTPPISVDQALADNQPEIKIEDADSTNSVPPPLPPRPKRVSRDSDDSASQSTPMNAGKTVVQAEGRTPLPELELPGATPINPFEEAMSGSITEKDVPALASLDIDNETTSKAEARLGGETSGADLLLPIMIYAVVKANPSNLVSQLLYVQRYRSHVCQTGEASYAVVNTTAVVEFLENVDLADLGLASTEKVLSVADLTPIGLTYLDNSNADTASIASASSRLRGRVSQVGELAGSAAGSANKVLTGVVDSSWTALRGLIAPSLGGGTDDVSNPPGRPKTARRSSTFSLANVTASVASIAGAATHRERPRATSWATREMVDVKSRPSSVREVKEDGTSETEDTESDDSDTENGDSERPSMTRSQSMVDNRSLSSFDNDSRPGRVSLSDRFAKLPGLISVGPISPGLEAVVSKSSQIQTNFLSNLTTNRASAHARRTTLLNPSSAEATAALHHERPESPSSASLPAPYLPISAENVAPPIEKFMTCELSELKLGEVGELLRDYRRLARLLTKESL